MTVGRSGPRWRSIQQPNEAGIRQGCRIGDRMSSVPYPRQLLSADCGYGQGP
jgi:hypothetical protein